MGSGQPGPHWNKDDIVMKHGDDVTIVVSKSDVTVWVKDKDGNVEMVSARRGRKRRGP